MSFFLFAKQIVDMLYAYKILDYIMVAVLLIMLVYQIILVRPSIKELYTKTDSIILALCICFTLSFCKQPLEYEIFFKLLSALLMYFVGRVYYERIQECSGALVTSSYLIIYLNFMRRIICFKGNLFQVCNASGDFYYYDTDMAYAMILSFIFIGMFGKNSIIKLITVCLICPYMVFYSDAGIQKLLMLVMMGIMIIYIIERVIQNHRLSNFALVSMIIGIVITIIFIYLPVMGIDNHKYLELLFQGNVLDYNNMRIRYIGWKEILSFTQQQGILEKLFGNGLQVSIPGGIEIESLYIKIYYSMGTVGILLSSVLLMVIIQYVVMIKDRKTLYLMVMLVILLLGSGVVINSMERVQMSWFALMYSGMVVSSATESEENEETTKHE